jgi:hypothetical protein
LTASARWWAKHWQRFWTIMRKLLLLSASLAFTSAAFATEPAITLEVMAGKVFVQTTSGLTAAKNGSALQPGETLVLKQGSAAMLSAAESGCFVSLREAGVYQVPALANCTPGQAAVLQSTAVINPANGYPDIPPDLPPDVIYPETVPGAGVIPPPPPPPPPVAASGFIFGAGFAATVAGVAIFNVVVEEDEVIIPVSHP